MQKKVIITGGSGYIGSHTITEILRNTDFEPICIDNNCRSFADTLDRVKTITGKDVKSYTVDICDKAALHSVFEKETGIVGIIHFAAYKAVGESVDKPLMYYHNNIGGLVNILECCEKYSISNFIFSSSCSVYGNVEKLPVTEETPTQEAESPYAHTKKVGEEIIKSFVNAHPTINAIPLRYFNPVGADESGLNGERSKDKPNNLVPIITGVGSGKYEKLTVFGANLSTRDGSCIRDYVHVSDIANAHIKALEYLLAGKNDSNYELLNLGSGNGVSVLEAIAAFEEVSGVKLNYELGQPRPGDVVAIYSDSTLAETKLNWSCKYDLNAMMSTAWKWEQTLKKERN